MGFWERVKETAERRNRERQRLVGEVNKLRHAPSDQLKKQVNPGWFESDRSRAARIILKKREQGKSK